MASSTSSGLAPDSLYPYAPSHGAAIFFTAAFAISLVWQTMPCSRFRSFKLMQMFLLTGLSFVGGFGTRIYSTYHPDNANVYMAAITIIWSSPPLYELANVQVLSRTMFYVPYYAPTHPGRALIVLGSVSAIIEILNGVGITYILQPSNPPDVKELGHQLVIASLAMQYIFIACFLGLVSVFHTRCAEGQVTARAVWHPLITLYVSTALMLARLIFRSVENFNATGLAYQPGTNPAMLKPVVRYEWPFYVFDASLMLINSCLWNVRHPGRHLPRSAKAYLARDNVTEIQGPGWKDSRPILLQLADPLGISAMFGTYAKDQVPFWETSGDGSGSTGGAHRGRN